MPEHLVEWAPNLSVHKSEGRHEKQGAASLTLLWASCWTSPHSSDLLCPWDDTQTPLVLINTPGWACGQGAIYLIMQGTTYLIKDTVSKWGNVNIWLIVNVQGDVILCLSGTMHTDEYTSCYTKLYIQRRVRVLWQQNAVHHETTIKSDNTTITCLCRTMIRVTAAAAARFTTHNNQWEVTGEIHAAHYPLICKLLLSTQTLCEYAD